MRKSLIGLVMFGMLACQQNENQQEEIVSKEAIVLDSLQQVIAQRDSAINAFIRDINNIQSNLDLIKQKEGLISTNLKNGDLEQQDAAGQIVYDIQAIQQLLEKNKEKLNQLRGALKKSNIKISELEKLIESLTAQIQEKDAQIAHLQTEVIRLNDELKYLFEQYNQRLTELNNSQEQLNKAYFVFGTVKELKEKQIISRSGGFIGIGRDTKLKEDFDKSYFTQIDIRETTSIPLYAKKANLITVHPSGSWHFVENNKIIEKLVIDNPDEFWSVSKYLVILVE